MSQTSLQSASSEQNSAPANGRELSSATIAVMPVVSADSPTVNATAQRKLRRKEKRARPEHCLNCGRRPLTTHFCPDCGQENSPHAISMAHLMGDVMEEFVKWDGRLFRSLALLLFFPGRLTQEYNAGRRVNYISPFKMYFVVSAIFVFLLSWSRPSDEIIKQRALVDPPIKISADNANPAAKTAVARNGSAPENKTRGRGKKSGDGRKAEKGKGAGDREALQLFGEVAFPMDYKLADNTLVKPGRYAEAYDQWEKDKNNKKVHPQWRQMMTGNVCRAIDNPGPYLGNLIQSIGKAMFFLLPLYAFLLAIFFFRSRRYYVEHLILAINNHTMAFLIGSVADISFRFVPVAGAPIGALLIFSYWLYELISLRVVYQRSWLGTMFRQAMIWGAYTVALIIGFTITALLTLILPS